MMGTTTINIGHDVLKQSESPIGTKPIQSHMTSLLTNSKLQNREGSRNNILESYEDKKKLEQTGSEFESQDCYENFNFVRRKNIAKDRQDTSGSAERYDDVIRSY